MGEACSKEKAVGDDREIEEQRRREQQDKRKAELREPQKIALPASRGAPPRDRIIALWARHEPEKLVMIDKWMEKLGNPRRAQVFIRTYITEKNGGEDPPEKDAAVKACFQKHFAGAAGGDKAAADAFEKYQKAKPGTEGAVFAEIFGVVSEEEQQRRLSAEVDAMSSSVEQGEMVMAGGGRALSKGGRFASVEGLDEKGAMMTVGKSGRPRRAKEDCSCDCELKDRIIAMLVKYDAESLGTICEEEDFYDSETGAELLYGLIEKFGEEPPSKKEAVTTLLRDLFEEHDPHRLRSLPTIVAAAMAVDGLQVVRKILRAYGIVKVSVGKSEKDSSVGVAAEGRLREQPFIPSYAVSVNGREQREFDSVPVENRHAIVSNYDKAQMYLAGLDQQTKVAAAGAAAAVAADGDAAAPSSPHTMMQRASSVESQNREKIDSLLDSFLGGDGTFVPQVDAPIREVEAVAENSDDDEAKDEAEAAAAAGNEENEFLPHYRSRRTDAKHIVMPDMTPSEPPVIL